MTKLAKATRFAGGHKSAALLAVGIVFCAAAMPIAVLADTYQFIIFGDPVAAATADSRSVASTATALVTATRSGGSAASPIEARFRTWDESDGIALRSDKYRATMIIFR